VTPFEAYPSFGGAISVAVGDPNGDGAPDVVTGASGGPRVRSFTLRLGRPSGLISFFATDAATTGQIWVAAADVAGEGTADIVTGSAAGQPAQAKVWGNVRDCASQPDGWHEYLVTASGESSLGRSSYTIAPGYWWADDANPALPRDTARWDTNIGRMAASGADWQLVLSFNEWGEATSVESATEWPSASGHGVYVDKLRAGTTSTSLFSTAGFSSLKTTARRLPTTTETTWPVARQLLGGPAGHGPAANDLPAHGRGKPTAPAAVFPLGHRDTVDRNGRSRRP
jgi:hypothetical protein